jgi:hypothetical protein
MPEWRAPIILGQQLQLERCPHCRVHLPTLQMQGKTFKTQGLNTDERIWGVYACKACGGIVVAGAGYFPEEEVFEVVQTFPQQDELSDEIPATARKYLHQAQESLHAPDGAVMLAASAVDAMLKAKGYREGWLNSRIKKAAEDHVITADMALWAHQVRLEANNPRHADDEEPHATPKGAKQAVEFAVALAHILFVLPSRVTRGLKEAGGTPMAEGGKLPETE